MSSFVEDLVEKRLLWDGIPAFENRTQEEKVKYCGRIIGRRWGLDGVVWINEHPCHQYTGEFICQKCLDRRENKRKYDYADRLTAVRDKDLSITTAHSDSDLVSIRVAAKRRGYEIMAIPNGDGTKTVFVDGHFEHKGEFGDLRRINYTEALKIVSAKAGLFSDKKVSGKLGKVDESDSGHDLEIRYISAEHRSVLFLGGQPSKYDDAQAYLLSITQIGRTFASEENIQGLIHNREEKLLDAYKYLGYTCFLSSATSQVKYRVDELNERWRFLDVGAYVYGDEDALDSLTAAMLGEYIRTYNDRIDDIDYQEIVKKSAEIVMGELDANDYK